jgi:hypothetical protein
MASDKRETMSFLIGIAALFFAFLALSAVAVAAVVLRFRVGASASWLYVRRCLIFSLPLAIGFAAFYLGFSRDPLWPNQDITEAQYIEYQSAYAQAQNTYATAAVLTSGALLWLIYRVAATFRDAVRPPAREVS